MAKMNALRVNQWCHPCFAQAFDASDLSNVMFDHESAEGTGGTEGAPPSPPLPLPLPLPLPRLPEPRPGGGTVLVSDDACCDGRGTGGGFASR